MMENKKYLCSFADTKLSNTAKRLKKQAENMDIYDEITMFDETMFEQTFLDRFEDKFSQRGFGYWCWKPQIVLQMFAKMNIGDIVHYCDSGCHLNIEGQKRLREYFNIVENGKSDFLAFEIPKALEKHWCKGDLIDFFEVRNNPKVLDASHVWAGTFFVKKTEHSQKVLEEWLNVFINHFSLADDTESVSSNFNGFKETRHDQSIFSLLSKKYEFELLHNRENTKYFANYPILALRDKGDSNKWTEIMSKPKVYRVLICESKFINKVRYTIEVILGQKVTQFINSLLN